MNNLRTKPASHLIYIGDNLAHAIAFATILSVFALFSSPSPAAVRPSGTNRISAAYCSRHPELFRVRPLTSKTASRLVQPSAAIPTVGKFEEGKVISGECARFIKTFGNGVILINDARFGIENFAFVPLPPADPSVGRQHSLFVPPANILKIDSNSFTEGKALSFVQNWPFGTDTELVLWSGRKKSVLGTVNCVGPKQSPCKLGHTILSSPYRIREFEVIPCLHGTACASFWFWITIRPGEQASARFAFDYGNGEP